MEIILSPFSTVMLGGLGLAVNLLTVHLPRSGVAPKMGKFALEPPSAATAMERISVSSTVHFPFTLQFNYNMDWSMR